MKGIQAAAGSGPGFGKLPPNVVFVVASDKKDLSAWQFSQEMRTFRQGEHLIRSPGHIQEIPDQRQDVWTVQSHRPRQAPVKGLDLVQIRRGQDFYDGCHGDNIAGSCPKNSITIVDQGAAEAGILDSVCLAASGTAPFPPQTTFGQDGFRTRGVEAAVERAFGAGGDMCGHLAHKIGVSMFSFLQSSRMATTIITTRKPARSQDANLVRFSSASPNGNYSGVCLT